MWLFLGKEKCSPHWKKKKNTTFFPGCLKTEENVLSEPQESKTGLVGKTQTISANDTISYCYHEGN